MGGSLHSSLHLQSLTILLHRYTGRFFIANCTCLADFGREQANLDKVTSKILEGNQNTDIIWRTGAKQKFLFPSPNTWSVREDDLNTREFPEAICRETSFGVDTTLGLG